MTKLQDVRSQMPGGQSRRNVSAIKKIARHHSGTTSGDAFSFARYHTQTKGWSTSGYHEVILRDGTVQLCYDPEVITNGVGGHNSYTYHICLVGNGSFTEAQERAWEERAKYNMERFGLGVDDVLGHREFPGHSSNTCPGIDMNLVRQRLREANEKQKPQPTTQSRQPQQQTQTSTFNLPAGILRRGSRGAGVAELQKALNALGHKAGVVDGIFGPQTESAVRRFQQAARITVDGIYGPQTKAALEKALNGTQTQFPLPDGVYRRGSTGQAVRQIQAALNRLGHDAGPIDGIYGPKTESSVRSFQQAAKIKVDGVYGTQTKRAMENELRRRGL